ncbi:hypothetical protein AAHC03_05723 [Spirometra sp. Aus1]
MQGFFVLPFISSPTVYRFIPYFVGFISVSRDQQAFIYIQPLFGILVDHVDLLTDRFVAASSIEEGRARLQEGFHDIERVLDAVLSDSVKYDSALYSGLSAVSFVRAYQRDVLVLLKLLLLERRILFSSDIAVTCLSTWLITLVSLLPGTLAGGLSLCTVVDDSWTRDRSCWPMAAHRARQEGVKRRESVDEDRASIASHTEETLETGVDALVSNPAQPQKTGFWSTVTKTASAFSARVQAAVAGQSAGVPTPSNGIVASGRSEKTNGAVELPKQETEQPNNSGELQEKSRSPREAEQSQPSQSNRSVSVFSKLLNRSQSAIRLSPPSDDTACRLRAMPASLHRAAQLSRPDRSFIDHLLQTIELWYAAKQYRLAQQQQSPPIDNDSQSVTDASAQPVALCDPQPTPVEATAMGREAAPQQSDLHPTEANASTQPSKMDVLLQSYRTVLQRFPTLAELEAWTRTQFTTYVKSLLLAADGRLASVADFNSTYITCFRATHCFLVWRNQYVPTLVSHSELREAEKSVDLNLDEPADDNVSRPPPLFA